MQQPTDYHTELPDDWCEACCKQPADIECAHGLLCLDCAKQVHGGDGRTCDVETK